MSYWNGTAKLVTVSTDKDAYGVSHKSESGRSVACNVYSISSSAYYAAAQAGVKPRAVIEVRRCAYAGERIVEFEGIRYGVESALRSGSDSVKLTLVERTGDR